MPFEGYVPEWLYERLPALYVVCGLLAIVMFASAYAILSGVILIGTGAAVWWMRRSYRAHSRLANRTQAMRSQQVRRSV